MKKFHVRPVVGFSLIFLFLLTVALFIASVFLRQSWMAVTACFLVFALFAIHDFYQSKHSLLRNFPLVGRARYLMEHLRAPFRQYFMEPDLNGKPFNRRQRSIVYQRAYSPFRGQSICPLLCWSKIKNRFC